MIIRRLRENENGKLDAIQSLAFSFSYDKEASDGVGLTDEVYGAFLDDNETLTTTVFTPEFHSCYHGKVFPSVGIGGVASLPEYRRLGAVRAIFDHIFSLAPERGWATSFLYPFSYSYYRQFGYERVIKRHALKCGARALDAFPRNTSAKLYQKDGDIRKEELLAVYNTWAARHNVVFQRNPDTHAWSDKPHKSQQLTYLWYTDIGEPAALATFRCHDGHMRVSQLCYTSPEGLRGILGFLRMFEGQVYEYEFAELPEDSELDLILRDYTEIEYREENGAMGRVLLPGTLLENNRYPEEHGHFRLRIDDPLPFNRGVWEVEYEHGLAEVTRHAFEATYDVSMTTPPLTRVLLGCGNFTPESASYLDGVELCGNGAADFFRAFPKHPAVLYERF